MAGKGPMRTPTAVLKARGSKLAKHRTGEPKFDRGQPTCPTWLTAEAKAEWRRIIGQLDTAGLMTLADRAALAAYCDAWADYVRAAAELKSALAKDGIGYAEAVRQGIVGSKAKAREAMLKAADRFGLSPAVRARVKANDDGDEDATPAILKGFKLA